ncbi:MAG: LAO/AO transport system kinase [Glaciecola sp.]|jgi:LAO/AO transport system kinase
MDIDELLARFDRGERRAIARALTFVEDGDSAMLRKVIAALHPRTGTATIIGITGSPGVGKSTLTNAIAEAFRGQDKTVAILAVDPSSPFTGGALLGDRVRMQGHHADPGVFIRSMAARGHLGGLSFATPQAVSVLDAAGFDVILIETVGVGQSEVEVAGLADSTIVAMAPGMGDGIQAAKAGILEVADLFVINKADQSGAGKLEAELRGMLEYAHAVGSDGAWWPPITRTVAVRGEGIPALVTALAEHHAHLVECGELVVRRQRRAAHLVREIAMTTVRARFVVAGEDDDRVRDLAARVAAGALDPYAAADQLLEAIELR